MTENGFESHSARIRPDDVDVSSRRVLTSNSVIRAKRSRESMNKQSSVTDGASVSLPTVIYFRNDFFFLTESSGRKSAGIILLKRRMHQKTKTKKTLKKIIL